MADLNKLKADVQKFCRTNDISLLDSDKFSEVGAKVEFEGKSYGEFLRLAKRLCIKVLYLLEYVEEFDPKKSVYKMEMGFPYNGVFNFFTATSDEYEQKKVLKNKKKFSVADHRWEDADHELEKHKKNDGFVDLDHPTTEKWEDRDDSSPVQKPNLPPEIKANKEKWEDHA